jgi:hypothetical protein
VREGDVDMDADEVGVTDDVAETELVGKAVRVTDTL